MIFKFVVFCITASMLAEQLSCISMNEAEKNPLKAYVLTERNGKKISDSGVRLGPLDFKYETEEKMKSYKLDQSLINRFKPYIGLVGEKASKALDANPLQVTQEEMDDIVQKVEKFYKSLLTQLPSVIKKNPNVIKLQKLADNRKWVEFAYTSEILRKKYNLKF